MNIEIIRRTADYIRYLSLMAISKANSGHPGLPLGTADIASIIYHKYLRFNSAAPSWKNRDRFILSAGHGSMLLYSLSYIFDYGIEISDIENFRQFNSVTPGHPEQDIAIGIETTTGPLGQGIANAVGSAIQSKIFQDRFNTAEYKVFDYNVYVLAGDGCHMEGISYESASIAGNLKLDNLYLIYDFNKISIDGNTNITFTEDIVKRYESAGWEAAVCNDEIESIHYTLKKLHSIHDRPKILIVNTTIGKGLNKLENTSKIHGSPADIDEIVFFLKGSSIYDTLSKLTNGQNLEQVITYQLEQGGFFKKEDILPELKTISRTNNEKYVDWLTELNIFKNSFPEKYQTLDFYENPSKLSDLITNLNFYRSSAKSIREICGEVLNITAKHIPQLIGGSADLASSTKAHITDSDYISSSSFSGRNIAFGIREHAMGSISNGLALDNMLIPFSSTFLTFSDYMKPAIRLAALMNLNHLFIFSHDSFYIGEDGPTHQPIEQLASLRSIPGLTVFRPANDIETAMSFLYFLKNRGPAAIITSRQKPDTNIFNHDFPENFYDIFSNGAYIFSDTTKPDIILSASGTEVSKALSISEILKDKYNISARIISEPSLNLTLFDNGKHYMTISENFSIPFFRIEAAAFGSPSFFTHPNVHLISVENFGTSAPPKDVEKYFNFDNNSIIEKILKQM